MVFAIMDSTVAYLLSLPLILVYLKSVNEENIIWRGSFYLWWLNLLVITHMASFGDTFGVVLMWQLMFIWPISIAIYIYLYQKDNNQQFYIGLKKRQVVTVGILTVLCVVSLGISMYNANKKVIVFHQQVMENFSSATDPNLFLITNTTAPSTLVDLPEEINQVKAGKCYAITYPWKSMVNVIIENEQHTVRKEFTYSRFYEGWKLDGIYNESSVINQ